MGSYAIIINVAVVFHFNIITDVVVVVFQSNIISDVVVCCCLSDHDECAAQPCQHDGVCKDTLGYYFCECVYPYTGLNCDDGM